MKIFIEQTDEQIPPTWEQVERNVRRIQERIYRATEKPTVPQTMAPTMWLQGAQGLSRVPGDRQARFLGGRGAAMHPGYPVSSSQSPCTPGYFSVMIS